MKAILRLLSFFAASFVQAAQPDLYVVLVDSLRPDHLGCYGYERDTSPAVDAFGGVTNQFSQKVVSLTGLALQGQQLYFLIRGNCLIFASAEGGDSERMRGCGGEGG